MSFSAAATMGSGAGGLGGAATRLDFGAGARLKFGQESESNFGRETETLSKFGGEKRSEIGKEKSGNAEFGTELVVAAPMTAWARSDTMVTVTRLEAPCCTAPGCLSPFASFSGVSATCVPHASDPSQRSPQPNQQMKRVIAWTTPRTTRARLPSQIGPKSSAYMVKD